MDLGCWQFLLQKPSFILFGGRNTHLPNNLITHVRNTWFISYLVQVAEQKCTVPSKRIHLLSAHKKQNQVIHFQGIFHRGCVCNNTSWLGKILCVFLLEKPDDLVCFILVFPHTHENPTRYSTNFSGSPFGTSCSVCGFLEGWRSKEFPHIFRAVRYFRLTFCHFQLKLEVWFKMLSGACTWTDGTWPHLIHTYTLKRGVMCVFMCYTDVTHVVQLFEIALWLSVWKDETHLLCQLWS